MFISCISEILSCSFDHHHDTSTIPTANSILLSLGHNAKKSWRREARTVIQTRGKRVTVHTSRLHS
jgi:hypothetical protein